MKPATGPLRTRRRYCMRRSVRMILSPGSGVTSSCSCCLVPAPIHLPKSRVASVRSRSTTTRRSKDPTRCRSASDRPCMIRHQILMPVYTLAVSTKRCTWTNWLAKIAERVSVVWFYPIQSPGSIDRRSRRNRPISAKLSSFSGTRAPRTCQTCQSPSHTRSST